VTHTPPVDAAGFYDPTDRETDTWTPLWAERTFATHVKNLRDINGLTQAALARALTQRGVPLNQPAIARLERSDDKTRRPIRLVEAAAIAEYFGKSLDEMTSTVVPISEEHRALLEAEQLRQVAYKQRLDVERELRAVEAEVRAVEASVEAAMAKFERSQDGKRRTKA
jgi:transcriptional regulator with XRE-family HTH domain